MHGDIMAIQCQNTGLNRRTVCCNHLACAPPHWTSRARHVHHSGELRSTEFDSTGQSPTANAFYAANQPLGNNVSAFKRGLRRTPDSIAPRSLSPRLGPGTDAVRFATAQKVGLTRQSCLLLKRQEGRWPPPPRRPPQPMLHSRELRDSSRRSRRSTDRNWGLPPA